MAHQASPNRDSASLPGQPTSAVGLIASCSPNDWKSCGSLQSLVDGKLRPARTCPAPHEPTDTLNSGMSPPAPQTRVAPLALSAPAVLPGPALRPAATPTKNAAARSTTTTPMASSNRPIPRRFGVPTTMVGLTGC